ncbi:MAG: helix-turn-helix domain-containing protein [Pseudomonadota bacterium]
MTTFEELKQTAGHDAAMRLIQARGGSRFTFPTKASGSILEGIVGKDAAQMLCEQFGGDYLDIPIAHRELAVWLHQQGWSLDRIACALRRTRRSVQRWTARA